MLPLIVNMWFLAWICSFGHCFQDPILFQAWHATKDNHANCGMKIWFSFWVVHHNRFRRPEAVLILIFYIIYCVSWFVNLPPYIRLYIYVVRWKNMVGGVYNNRVIYLQLHWWMGTKYDWLRVAKLLYVFYWVSM